MESNSVTNNLHVRILFEPTKRSSSGLPVTVSTAVSGAHSDGLIHAGEEQILLAAQVCGKPPLLGAAVLVKVDRDRLGSSHFPHVVRFVFVHPLKSIKMKNMKGPSTDKIQVFVRPGIDTVRAGWPLTS